jgi:hypothetical protein
MAGPGLDLFTLFLSATYNFIMIVIGYVRFKQGLFPKLYLFASILSFAIIYHFMHTAR